MRKIRIHKSAWRSGYEKNSDRADRYERAQPRLTGVSVAEGTLGEHRGCEPFDRYSSMLSAFAEMVRGERENPYTYDYELLLFRTLLRCCEENM